MIDEVSRYSYFCQFRSTIRISRKHLIVGIDIAKNKNHAFFGTAYGKTLWKRLLFSNDRKGYMRLIEQVNALISQHQLEQVIFGMEPTGNYHKPLAVQSTILCEIIFSHIFNKWQVTRDFSYGFRSPVEFHF